LVLVVVIVLFSVKSGVVTKLYQDSRWPPLQRSRLTRTPPAGTQSVQNGAWFAAMATNTARLTPASATFV